MIDFVSLYDEHAERVYRFSYWLCGDRAVAEDITSETFTRVWTARERVDIATVTGYLLTIARNLYLQGAKRARRNSELLESPPDPRPGPQRIVENQSELRAVLADVSTLTETERAALLMRAHYNVPYAEIAAALGITLANAKVKVHRARLKLARRRLQREGSTP